jgi:hypothetical protein
MAFPSVFFVAHFLNPLVSKRLFSPVQNEEGYSYGINSPINRQILQLESHEGQKTEHFYFVWLKFYCKGNMEKVVKNQERSVHCKTHN